LNYFVTVGEGRNTFLYFLGSSAGPVNYTDEGQIKKKKKRLY
jgi:hypothetical protein